MDQVGQGTQHTEALVCREETGREVSVWGVGGEGRSEGEEDPRRYSTISWHLILLSPESCT